MACGVPPVVTRVGGLPEVVIDGESGLLGELGDEEALAGRLLDLLSDEPRHAAMAKAARERAVSEFEEGRGISAYEEAYRRLLKA